MTALDLLTAISGTKSLSALDGYCRAVWSDWGAGRLTDDQAQSLAETIEARRREVRGTRHGRSPRPAGGGAGEGGGTAESFPAEAQSDALAEPTRVDRAAPNARRVRPHAAAARLPVHDGGAGGAQDRRRRRAGPGGLPPDPWRDRGAGGGVRDDGAGRLAPGGARGASHDRRAPARQAAEPRQCRADHFPRMDELDCARRAGESAAFRFQGGRVQKNGVHG